MCLREEYCEKGIRKEKIDKNWNEKAPSKWDREWSSRVGKFFLEVNGLGNGLPSRIAIAEY